MPAFGVVLAMLDDNVADELIIWAKIGRGIFQAFGVAIVRDYFFDSFYWFCSKLICTTIFCDLRAIFW